MMGRKQKSSAKKLAVGGAVVAVAGFVAGILTAPKSGKETRSDIKSATNKGVGQAEKELKKLHTDLGKVIDQGKKQGGKLSGKSKKEFDQLVVKAKDAKEKTRDVLSAIHEGDAEDKDLQRAVQDAKAAVAHLKDYLKK
jgi:gas vesicle protein